MVRFHKHPEDALCIPCTEWLYTSGRPIARRLRPAWQLAARMRALLAAAR